jgi:hypothetical protein
LDRRSDVKAFDLVVTAYELRQKAERYRILAGYICDEHAVAVIRDMAERCDKRAIELEQTVGRLHAA